MAQLYPDQLQQIAALIDQGVIKIFIVASFNLEHPADAETFGEWAYKSENCSKGRSINQGCKLMFSQL